MSKQFVARMELKDNAHNHLVSEKWGWVDLIDCYGKKHERIIHWTGYEQRDKLEKVVRDFNKFSGHGDYIG